MNPLLRILLLLCVLACTTRLSVADLTGFSSLSADEISDDGFEAPIMNEFAPTAIANEWIIKLKDNTPLEAFRDTIARRQGAVSHKYEHVFKGFAVKNVPKAAVSILRKHKWVEYIEPVLKVQLNQVQTDATWGLDRVDQRDLPLDTLYKYNRTGAGVNVYVVDTGIQLKHEEFEGRALPGFSAFNDNYGSVDCNGHGTHCAGTIGGKTYGVAKDVTLYAVRVLSCSGSGSIAGVVGGIDWVVKHAAENGNRPSVASMSLGGGATTALDNAVNNAVKAGITFVVAAGNENQNACNVSPARAELAITVLASTNKDERAYFSNWGTCTTIFAPGLDITSAWYTSNTATKTISGTSMATPHVSGAAALYLEKNPTATPEEVEKALVNNGTKDVLQKVGTGSPNVLLYTGFMN